MEFGEPQLASTSASTTTTRKTTIVPGAGTRAKDADEIVPLYHVVLLNDDEHTFEYVIEMLGAIFSLPPPVAYRHAVEVDATGRTIVMTCELPQAEFGRDQIHAYGADPRSEASKGSMQARVEPAGNPA
jgi:ATP-dependent Clp protease adaptor protein ClpS